MDISKDDLKKIINETIKERLSEESKYQVELLYTVKETSKILKVGIHKVYDLIDNGLLLPLKLGSLKIPAVQLEKFIADYTGKDLTDLKNIKDS